MLIILKDSVTCTPAASILDPLFQTSTWKLLPEKDQEQYILHQVFGYDSCRAGQLESIQRLMQGKDTLTLIPTGVRV